MVEAGSPGWLWESELRERDHQKRKWKRNITSEVRMAAETLLYHAPGMC